MKKLVKLIKLNNVQYNANRDPEIYRRVANQPFRVQAVLDGTSEATCKITDAGGRVLNEQKVRLPGTYSHEFSFPTPGVRVVTLTVEGGGETFRHDLRLDVLDHAWIG